MASSTVRAVDMVRAGRASRPLSCSAAATTQRPAARDRDSYIYTYIHTLIVVAFILNRVAILHTYILHIDVGAASSSGEDGSSVIPVRMDSYDFIFSLRQPVKPKCMYVCMYVYMHE